ncbi:lytic murein transglycosylase B [Rhodoferax saidenbachensis]|uniref:lytic murein transglycosylase B n=1 Tax=Rhodoferax saidenbachensis TaxID=1484693 RepID=UPI00286B545C|nr:lytic murein transglycosylase B [Rhodoferax saidenbachensis]
MFSLRLIATFLIAACAVSAGASTPKHHKLTAKHAHRAKVATPPPAAANAGPLYATRPEVMLIADDIAQRRNLDRDWVRNAVGQSRMVASVVRAITPPAVGTPKNWALYRSRFVEPIRIRAGVKFWQDNRETLERAERETGVPASIIVGIIGVETIYGQQTGTYRVIDALTTLAFDFPGAHPRKAERAAFFLSELEAFLSLTARTQTDPLALRGSYAGAMGLPQFMPSSWAKYAIDFDGDSRVDLFHSAPDVIGSVANYFVAYKWQRDLPTHYPVQLDPARLDRVTLLAPDIVPSFTPQAMADKGVLLDATALAHPGKLALVELQNGADAPLYIAGTDNFYAITRYNWSSYYALAVIELGNAVAAAVGGAPAVPK